METHTQKSHLMKNLFLITTVLLFAITSSGQTSANLIIFSEDGDPFFAYINGVKQNNTAQTNLRFTNLTPNLSVKIEFENNTLPVLKQVMILEPGMEHTARIKRDLKKQLRLRYFGSVRLDEATVQYNTEGDPALISSEEIPQGDGCGKARSHGGGQVRSSERSCTDPATGRYPDRHSSGYRAAMRQTSFNKMKASVEAKSFSDTKMSTAKVATKNNYLSVSQIKVIAGLFTMDDDRLTYAKFAYDYCVDKANYYQVSDVFKFSSSTDELNAFLSQ